MSLKAGFLELEPKQKRYSPAWVQGGISTDAITRYGDGRFAPFSKLLTYHLYVTAR
jgi:hypothetical protein